MAKMLVIYKTPADPAAFDRHYKDIHAPLAKSFPACSATRSAGGRS
ncbi:EthD family reductase [Mesorhizobium sp. ORM6]